MIRHCGAWAIKTNLQELETTPRRERGKTRHQPAASGQQAEEASRNIRTGHNGTERGRDGIGRHSGLKSRWPARAVWVQVPPSAPIPATASAGGCGPGESLANTKF